jgi:hypothetical protein
MRKLRSQERRRRQAASLLRPQQQAGAAGGQGERISRISTARSPSPSETSFRAGRTSMILLYALSSTVSLYYRGLVP